MTAPGRVRAPLRVIVGGNVHQARAYLQAHGWSARDCVVLGSPERLRGLRGPLEVHRIGTYRSERTADYFERVEASLAVIAAVSPEVRRAVIVLDDVGHRRPTPAWCAELRWSCRGTDLPAHFLSAAQDVLAFLASVEPGAVLDAWQRRVLRRIVAQRNLDRLQGWDRL